MKTLIITTWLLSQLLTAPAHAMGSKPASPPPAKPAPAPAPTPAPAPSVDIRLLNLTEPQRIVQHAETLLRVQTSQKVDKVQVFANGGSLGLAEYRSAENEYRMTWKFQYVADFDLKFVAHVGKATVSKTVRVSVVRDESPVPTPENPPAPPSPVAEGFNDYILRAIAHIDRNYALLGYNIDSQLTHDLQFGSAGVMKATGGARTMCVSAQLEIIVTALQLYAQETGDHSPFAYLPFRLWNTLDATGFKARVWVDPKLDAYGTADALAHFGMGKLVSFEELKPGDFLNINRVNGSGHAVTFISYLDSKGNELPRYNSSVTGFKYYSSQGSGTVGQGGMSYRYAYFDKFGCPNIPYKRDCGLVWRAADRKFLLMGTMYHPKNWRMPAAQGLLQTRSAPSLVLSEEDMSFHHKPARFNGLTTDD